MENKKPTTFIDENYKGPFPLAADLRAEQKAEKEQPKKALKQYTLVLDTGAMVPVTEYEGFNNEVFALAKEHLGHVGVWFQTEVGNTWCLDQIAGVMVGHASPKLSK